MEEVVMVELGDKVKDMVSGFEGIAITRHSYLQGCDRITVQPSYKKKESTLPDYCAFDEPQLKVLKKGVVLQGSKINGGPHYAIDQGKAE